MWSNLEAALVDPYEAKRFVEEIKWDFLAPAIGTSHGAFKFKGEARLDFERLKKVKELTGLPLRFMEPPVFPKRQPRTSPKNMGWPISALCSGEILVLTCEIWNKQSCRIQSDLRMAFIASLKKPQRIPGNSIRENTSRHRSELVKNVIKARMRLLGCLNKA